MKPTHAAFAAAILVPTLAFSQPKGVIDTAQIEAVVTVMKVDHKARTVTVKGPQGNERTLQVPPEANNLDKVKAGDRFKMIYAEAVAIAVSRGGEPSASADRQVKVSPKGGTPGGYVVKTQQITGVVDAIDYKNRYVALRGPGQNTLALPVSEDVKNLDQVKAGDTITVAYAQALAVEMIAEPKAEKKKAPAKKKAP